MDSFTLSAALENLTETPILRGHKVLPLIFVKRISLPCICMQNVYNLLHTCTRVSSSYEPPQRRTAAVGFISPSASVSSLPTPETGGSLGSVPSGFAFGLLPPAAHRRSSPRVEQEQLTACREGDEGSQGLGGGSHFAGCNFRGPILPRD